MRTMERVETGRRTVVAEEEEEEGGEMMATTSRKTMKTKGAGGKGRGGHL